MDLTGLLEERNIPHRKEGEHHHCRSGWIQLDCPYCSPGEERFRLGYSLSGAFFNCWSCGHHRTYETLKEVLRLTNAEAAKLTSTLRASVLPSLPREKDVAGKLTLPGKLFPLSERHKEYLKERSLDPEEVGRRWGLCSLGMDAGWLQWRLLIPIHYQGEMVSWTTRKAVSGESRLRYRAAQPHQEKLSHRRLLFGEDFVRDAIIVVEGPFDVFRIGPGAVAVLGTSYDAGHVLRMSKYLRRYICFDAEAAAQARARKLCDDLSPFPGQTSNILLEYGKDAGSTDEKELHQLRRLL